MCLLLLVASVPNECEVEAHLPDMLKADVLGAEEGGEFGVGGGAEVEGDIAVEGLDGEGVELFVHEADVFEVGGADDLGGGSE